jgi:SAM-dependent methyltransferase
MKPDVSRHYDSTYFSWQSEVGSFGGWANRSKFDTYVMATNRVIDFGCGGGFLVSQLPCAERMGVEVNPVAADAARSKGVRVFSSSAELPDGVADIVISNHALEHALNPLEELKQLYRALVPSGRIVFYVPCETIRMKYVPGDRNHHLFSWSPLCLGNLFTEAGFLVEECTPYIHKWPRHYEWIARTFGRTGFEVACRLSGRLSRDWFQVRLIGRKPGG